jgi:hypothetical protein
VHVQAVFSELSVARFNECILSRFAWPDEVQFGAGSRGPEEHGFTGKLSIIVADDRLRYFSFEPIEFARQAITRDREVDHLQDDLAREAIDDIRYPEPSTVSQLIRDDIHRPALIDGGRQQQRDPRPIELLVKLPAPPGANL